MIQSCPSCAEDHHTQIDRLYAKVDALTAEAARLREMLSNAQAERDMIRQDAMQTAARVAELERENEQLATAYRNL
jgi:hypothetical protein